MQKVKLDSHLWCFEDAGYCIWMVDKSGSVVYGDQHQITNVIEVKQVKICHLMAPLWRVKLWNNVKNLTFVK